MSETLRQKYERLLDAYEQDDCGIYEMGPIARELFDILQGVVEASEKESWVVVAKRNPAADYEVFGPFASSTEAEEFSLDWDRRHFHLCGLSFEVKLQRGPVR